MLHDSSVSILFSLFSIILSSISLIHFSPSSSLLCIASNRFTISVVAFFTSDCYFFSSLIYVVSISLSSIFLSSPVSILMIAALNYPPGMVLKSVLLRLLSMALSFSFGMNSSILAFCLGLCPLLSVKKLVMFLATENNGFVKKKSCSVQGLMLQRVCGVFLCVACYCDLATFSFRLVICRGSPCLQWAVFCPWPEWSEC